MALFREMGASASTFLVIGNMIGIGIFTTSGLIIEQLSTSPWLIGVWIGGGGLALIGATCYARLGARYPQAGGEYAFLRPAFGPLPAFLSGWASLFIGFTAPLAASALGLAHYSTFYLPAELRENQLLLRLIAFATLLTVSALVCLGLRAGSQLHSAVTILNVGLLFLFSLAVLWHHGGSSHLPAAVAGELVPEHLPSLASAIVLVMFTFSGWNAAAYVGGEIRDPACSIPKALIFGTLAVTVAYLLINAAYLSAVPAAALNGRIAVAEVTAAATFGPFGQHFVNLLILASILSSLTAMAIAGPRVYYAMAQDNLFPGWLGDVNLRRKAPIKAIWFQTSIALLFVSFGSLFQILLYSGFVLMLFSTLTVATLLLDHHSRLLPAIFVVTHALILAYATVSNPWAALAGYTTVAAGLPVYYYFKRRPGP